MLDKESQMEYARSMRAEVRMALATYPHILPEVVDYMLQKEELYAIKRRLLSKADSNISSSTLALLAKKEKDEEILKDIAHHLNTDAEVLEYLAMFNMRRLNLAVASNPNTKQSRLDIYANSNNELVRHAVFLNPNTREETRKRLHEEFRESFWGVESWYDLRGIKTVASGN